jgi:hypothetical protein
MRISFLLIFLFLLFASCEKKQEEAVLPDWLEEFINERNKDGMCYYTSAMRYIWRGQYYYQLYSPVSSCYLCDVFNEAGEREMWETYEEIENYELFRKEETILWVCEM